MSEDKKYALPAEFELHGIELEGQMLPGGDVRNLVKAILHWVITTISSINVTLNDTSNFSCQIGKKSQYIQLADYHFLLYGTTWYEKVFGAIQNDIEYNKIIKEMRSAINNPSGLKLADFWNKCFGSTIGVDKVGLWYKSTLSWQEIFIKILAEFGCAIFYGRLPFIYKTIGINSSFLTSKPWTITPAIIQAYDIEYKMISKKMAEQEKITKKYIIKIIWHEQIY